MSRNFVRKIVWAKFMFCSISYTALAMALRPFKGLEKVIAMFAKAKTLFVSHHVHQNCFYGKIIYIYLMLNSIFLKLKSLISRKSYLQRQKSIRYESEQEKKHQYDLYYSSGKLTKIFTF